jgi:hypothetical protein
MASEFTLNEGFNPKGQAELIIKGFGLANVKPKFYNIQVNSDEIEQQGIGDLNKSLSLFGLPVFDVLDFDQLKYTTADNKNITVEALSMATVLIDVTQTKNIVTTPIQGRNGTVKEYISDGDYAINIKGVLVGNGNEVRPEDKLGVLLGFCQAPVPINVASNILASFGIYTIVIDSYTFNQMEGQRNVIPFELNCLSETPFEIKAQTQNTTAGRTTTTPRFI